MTRRRRRVYHVPTEAEHRLRVACDAVAKAWHKATGRRTMNAGLLIYRYGSLTAAIAHIVNLPPGEMWWLAKRLMLRHLTYEHLVRTHRELFDYKTRAIARDRTYDIFNPV